MGKLFLIEALVDGNYTWLGVAIAIGTMVSLAYYLRVVAAMWMQPTAIARPTEEMPAIAGASPETDPIDLDAGRRPYLVGPALLAAAATVFFGVIPQPLGRLGRARRRCADAVPALAADARGRHRRSIGSCPIR